MRYRWLCGLMGTIAPVLALLFITCDDDEDASRIRIVYVDTEILAGSHVLPWRQDYESGEKVPPGDYVIRMEAGSYQHSVGFTISTSNQHVSAACDTPSMIPGMLPNSYALSLDTSDYAPGDTVCILYDLPITSHLRLVIQSASRWSSAASSSVAD